MTPFKLSFILHISHPHTLLLPLPLSFMSPLGPDDPQAGLFCIDISLLSSAVYIVSSLSRRHWIFGSAANLPRNKDFPCITCVV
jgi:hypothetical protein